MRVEALERFLILAAGGALMVGWTAVSLFLVRDQVSWLEGGILLGVAALFAPVYLVGHRVFGSAPSLGIVVTSVAAMIAVASHPIVPRRSTAAVAIVGFVLWGFCTSLVTAAAV
jgi:hypothetical protein